MGQRRSSMGCLVAPARARPALALASADTADAPQVGPHSGATAKRVLSELLVLSRCSHGAPGVQVKEQARPRQSGRRRARAASAASRVLAAAAQRVSSMQRVVARTSAQVHVW